MQTTTSQSTSTVTFTKLRSGDWGARVVGPAPSRGATLTVTRKDGSRDTVTVATVVWTGRDDVGRTLSLCAIERTECPASRRPATPASPRSSGRCRECGGPLVSVAYHRAMGGLCGQCAFDEYDC